jgi:hypothetical protein
MAHPLGCSHLSKKVPSLDTSTSYLAVDVVDDMTHVHVHKLHVTVYTPSAAILAWPALQAAGHFSGVLYCVHNTL